MSSITRFRFEGFLGRHSVACESCESVHVRPSLAFVWFCLAKIRGRVLSRNI